MHWDLLDAARRKILPSLVFLKKWKCSRAGGTALALQIGHRRSVDFDFFTPESFNEMRLEQEVVSHLRGFKVTQRGQGTLTGQAQGIDFSFFHYPYPLLEPLIEEKYLNLAATADIAAMKLIAISQRGLRRDFVDLYVIAQGAGLKKIFEWAGKNSPNSTGMSRSNRWPISGMPKMTSQAAGWNCPNRSRGLRSGAISNRKQEPSQKNGCEQKKKNSSRCQDKP